MSIGNSSPFPTFLRQCRGWGPATHHPLWCSARGTHRRRRRATPPGARRPGPPLGGPGHEARASVDGKPDSVGGPLRGRVQPFLLADRCRPARARDPPRGPWTRVPAVARRPGLLALARGGVCRALPVTREAVRSYRTLSPLPRTPCGAVRRSALCCTVPHARPRAWVAVSHHRVQSCPDFPPRRPGASRRLHVHGSSVAARAARPHSAAKAPPRSAGRGSRRDVAWCRRLRRP